MARFYFQAFSSAIVVIALTLIHLIARPSGIFLRGVLILAGLLAAVPPAFAASASYSVSLTEGTPASDSIMHDAGSNGGCGVSELTAAPTITSGSVPGLSLVAEPYFGTGAVLRYSGTPTTPGTYSVTMDVPWSDWLCFTGSGTDVVTVTFTVAPLPAPTASAVTATVVANSTDNSITLSLGGGTATSVAVDTAPSHGTATASGTSITYTPTSGYSGSDSFTYTATNATGTSAAATVSITVSAPTLSLSPTSLSSATVGSSYSASLSASLGTAPYSYAVTAGALPTSLSLSSSGAISGTPTAAGTFSFTVTATDDLGATGSQAYSIAVAGQAPTAANVSATVAANSTGNAIALSLGGGTATSVAVDTNATHGTATASGTSITYTPTAGFSGTDSFTYTATNASGTSSPATVSVTVSAPTLSLSPTSLPSGTVGSSYSASLSASLGTAPYSYAVTAGALPAGLSLSSSGIFSGTPTSSGTSSFTVTATDDLGATGSRAYAIAVAGTASTAPTASNVSATVAANSSGNAITLSLGGGAASSVAVDAAPSNGTAIASGTSITYTPTAGFSGSDSFTYTATNTAGTSSPATVSITVSAPVLSISPSGSLSASVGDLFSQTFTAGNGAAPYSFAMSGTLPDGLAFDAPSATLSGTPTEAGTYALTLSATDHLGASSSVALSLTVEGDITAPPITASTSSGLTSTVDLTSGATGGPFTGATLVSLSPPSAGTALIVLDDTAASSGSAAFAAALSSGRYKLRFTADPTFTGTAIATYTLTSASGTSAPSTVTFTVSARPLLNNDADLVGLVEAQARAAARLADVQIDTVQDHLRSLRGKACLENNLQMNAGDGHGGSAPVSGNAGCSPIAGGNLAFWTAGSIMLGDGDSDSGASGSSYTTVNVTAGLDYRVSEHFIAGLGLGFANDEDDIGSNGTTSSNRAASLSAYGLYTPGNGFYLDGLAGVGLLDFQSLRTTASAAEAEAERDGYQFFAAFGGGYDWTAGALTVSPHGRISASRSVLDTVTETGAGLENASLSRQTIETLTATLGFDVSYAILLDNAVLKPELTLDFSHSLFDSGDTSATYADSGWPIDYVIPGTTDRKNNVVLGLGVTLIGKQNVALSSRYRATFNGDGVLNQAFHVDLSGRF